MLVLDVAMELCLAFLFGRVPSRADYGTRWTGWRRCCWQAGRGSGRVEGVVLVSGSQRMVEGSRLPWRPDGRWWMLGCVDEAVTAGFWPTG